MNAVATNYPHPKLLQKLANGSLDQSHNLTRAIRLWALLRWLYSDEAYTTVENSFTYNDWREAFFTKTHKDEKQVDILNHQDPNCACIKTTKQWLLRWEVPIDEWQNSLQKQIPISNSELDKLLEEPLFAQVRKSLQSDLDLLVSRNCLQRVNNFSGRSKYYCRVDKLPNFSKSEDTFSKLTLKKQAYLAGALGIFSFLDPTYPLLAEEFSEEVDEDNHRIFLYVDYVVPESSDIQDRVDEIQSELQEIWNTGHVQPLLLTYHSAHQNQIKECVIYPVCIYFMERAKYLCTYGTTPKGDINWYKYRLDRIISKHLEILEWQDPRVSQLLREKHQDNKLPTPKTVNAQLKEAWGCDFYKEKALMVLRFEQDFHQAYIEGISIHDTFTQISYDQTVKLTQQYTLNLERRKAIVDILQSRPSTDAYYKVDYRVTDYYVVRWLRALGSKVEVLLPWVLREEMALEIQNTWNLYKTRL
ncbi:TIGR03985 family CRISPR-associated protein [Nostoc sp. 'Peltigera membranacea cyanobiont' 213]|uniref:TIGR03985 family CRISPR-associated protein n=1 Tax=Nostoc sp. 'Peltigera membranacea cyanobiont' 213 TaxID=2014530 RepID=UPI000B95AC16|nr:TIGR03985 family CRISPR-associated protein [Nostoc sp. 'Peltigera membranacea cyanobiont' 213]OYD99387.1 TIGR03985 family CRISPR-associated protein [Nostoc sp. 'Peltigera membranacea cyanobiont' 213]